MIAHVFWSVFGALRDAAAVFGDGAIVVGAICLGIEPAMLTMACRSCFDALAFTFVEHA